MHTHTPALMIQGTSSDAGKSLLAAAFCRILTQDGLRVAPFKSQNMALNSCVTPDGLEMGRAQALQAAACRRPPDARMNPVLLKPTSHTGSQVIVMGKPVGNMRVREYWQYKPTAFRHACDAYDSLAREADVMILEGAGSPAEINLREHDIVNMAMARYADARVLLAGDIDRGGVFASLVGTLELLKKDERDRIAGLVINKFRGDASLLPPALDYVSEKTGKPFFGVIPWIEGLTLPDEDSVSFKAGQATALCEEKTFFHGCLDIALVDLPHISNFTDMDALDIEPDVKLRIVRGPGDLDAMDRPDMIIIPGSKNTLHDLGYLRETGLASLIIETCRAPDGPVILGICAGLQMLGERIADPLGLEQGGQAQGLGLLALETTLEPVKTLRKLEARTCEGQYLHGYEIHHGTTSPTTPKTAPGAQSDGDTHPLPWMYDESDAPCGWMRTDNRVFGSYVHGLFDDDAFRRHFLNNIRSCRGLAPVTDITKYDLEPGLDRLAETVRAHVDMNLVRAVLGL